MYLYFYYNFITSLELTEVLKQVSISLKSINYSGKTLHVTVSRIKKSLVGFYQVQQVTNNLNTKKYKRKTWRGIEQRNFSVLVKNRDNNTCQNCGIQNTVMYAHHIDKNKDNCHIDNGITLCKQCHIDIHKTNKQ